MTTILIFAAIVLAIYAAVWWIWPGRKPAVADEQGNTTVTVTIILVFFALLCLLGTCWGAPKYAIYRKELRGVADLREAEWNKKILVEQAKAEYESSKLKAAAAIEQAKGAATAEVERSKGTAQANKILGESLRGKTEYLQYLWIDALKENFQSSTIVYVPTENGMPIMEAGRVSK